MSPQNCQPKTWVEVSESALRNNLNIFQRLVGGWDRVCAVVKSNAYGHGLVEAAKIAEKTGVGRLAVDSAIEAWELRKNGIHLPILILGYIPKGCLAEVIEKDCAFVAYDERLPELLAEIKTEKKIRVHLKIETGTVRQGLDKVGAVTLAKRLIKNPNVEIEGVYTHFANVEDTSDPSFAMKQLDRFNEVCTALEAEGIRPKIKHTASSAAALLYPAARFDLIRPGISMYGYWSSKETQAVIQQQDAEIRLKPVLEWKTRIAQVKTIPAGTAVSYGLTERVSRATKIAVLPVGYWDGVDRGLSSVGVVLVRGVRCKIVGRVCMNMMMVDVTDVPNAQPDEEVCLIGKQGSEQITADEIAGKLNTISYEVITRINPVLPRYIVG